MHYVTSRWKDSTWRRRARELNLHPHLTRGRPLKDIDDWMEEILGADFKEQATDRANWVRGRPGFVKTMLEKLGCSRRFRRLYDAVCRPRAATPARGIAALGLNPQVAAAAAAHRNFVPTQLEIAGNDLWQTLLEASTGVGLASRLLQEVRIASEEGLLVDYARADEVLHNDDLARNILDAQDATAEAQTVAYKDLLRTSVEAGLYRHRVLMAQDDVHTVGAIQIDEALCPVAVVACTGGRRRDTRFAVLSQLIMLFCECL